MTRAAVKRGAGVKLALELAAALIVVAALGIVPSIRAEVATRPLAAEAALVPDAEASDESGGIAVRVMRGPEGLEVEGHCRVEASRTVAWSVLTDYDAIGRFVSSMRESRITSRGEGFRLVDQVAVARFFLFSRRMHATLRVVEEPPGRIRFEDVLHRDFASYRGEWRVEEAGEGTEIVYRVAARPAFSIPDFVAQGLFRRTARDLMSQVAAEMARRQAVAGPRSQHDHAREVSGRSDDSGDGAR